MSSPLGVQLNDLVAARRWLDSRRREAALPSATTDDPVTWRGRTAVADAVSIGVALARQLRQAEARIWLRAAARVAPARLLAEIGGSLVDAAAVADAEDALRRGADAGDVQSALSLGRLLLFDGRDEEAGQWLRQAIESDPETARFLLSDLRLRGAHAVADQWARVAAEIGDGEAAVQLAWSAARRGDREETERWLSWADQLGHPGITRQRLGIALDRADPAEVRRWLEVLAGEGDPQAQLDFGRTLLGEGREADGWALVRRAADGGQVAAQLQLAARAGAEGDREELTRWMLAAARTEPGEASEFAEVLLSAGQPDLAEDLLRACVEGGHDLSRVPLGRLLVGRSALAEAVDVVRPAAELRLPEGGVLLGLAQEKRGLLDAARHAYLRAAGDGDGRAAHKLGMLSSAAGDDEGARRWFVEGARAGEASSMFNLARMQSTPDRGARWMVLAAAHQHPAAALHVGYREVELGRPAEGVRWLRYARELGEPHAADALAVLLAQAPSLRGVGLSEPGRR